MEGNPLLSAIPFNDPGSAAQSRARLAAVMSPQLAAAIPGLLAESPDPDSSLLLFERLLSESSGEVVRLLERNHPLAHYAIVVFGHSRYLGETLIRNTDLLQSLLRDRTLDRSFSTEEYRESLARFRSRSFEKDLALLLARFKRREYVRIMLRDVLRIAPLAETTAEISALTDVIIEAALREAERELRERFGPAQHLGAQGRLQNTPFTILSLGKLGGNELNYSSDVDLMFVYGDGEEGSKATLSNREYFVRLAQGVTGILSRLTHEGSVFRIDLRLRPQGGQGEMAVSLGNALRYYADTALDWELQAMIKVRYTAGDAELARAFIRGVQPRVYTEHLNLEAIETVLAARERMARRRGPGPVEGSGLNVKIGRGGIRDIEFLVQCLQRVHGGAEPWLRSGGTLFSLQKLHDKRHITGRDFQELSSAYEFLRHLEHRLQLRQGQQTHRLPGSPAELAIVQRALAAYELADAAGSEELVPLVSRRMAAVAEIYDRIIHQQQCHSKYRAADAEFQLRSGLEPSLAEHSNRQILERLSEDSPALYRTVAESTFQPVGRRNCFRFLSSVFTSSERYAALIRNPEGLRLALPLFEASAYLTDILVRHPDEIATLSELSVREPGVRTAGLFEGHGMQRAGGDATFAYLAETPISYGEKLSLLRRHYRHRVFVSGAIDIDCLREVYSSLATTTAAAEDAIAAAFAIVGAPEGLAVMALGRLGTGEFDVLSDADLLFVCDEKRDRVAVTKASEQIMQALAAYTLSGMLFPVDTRLRPRGAEGELLVSPVQLEAYFKHEAQPWEALTYTKLRFLAGSQELGLRATETTEILFRRFAGDPNFPNAVREMRAKLESAERSLKTSPGGIYDIDFLASYLQVKHPSGARQGTLRDRLWQCADLGILPKTRAATLDHAAESLRTVEHITRLVTGRANKWLATTEHGLEVTTRLVAQVLGRELPDGLEPELRRTCAEVRRIYEEALL